MSAPSAWDRAETAGRVARELGNDLALRRSKDPALSRWHPLAIVATGFVGGAVFGRIVGLAAPRAAAAGLLVPLAASLQRMSISALHAWWQREHADKQSGADGQGEPGPAPADTQ